ncbi:uncharacterized protein LOC117892835 [Drosophila subobscura]|uniref:uncharacterized protein LOC117892835 n=1 Tax=Drosophila subobscura TaxID=7241 RepID=UPI00155B3299|nr:uncharacterized protein LOC117892835 [Drosophila subobscura]
MSKTDGSPILVGDDSEEAQVSAQSTVGTPIPKGTSLQSKKPDTFVSSEEEEDSWMENARHAARKPKEPVLSGEIDVDQMPADLLHVRPARKCLTEQQEVEIMVENNFVQLCQQISKSLTLCSADVGRAQRALDEIRKLELNKMMLLRNPECLDAVHALCTYIGNLSRWNMDKSEEKSFKEAAQTIRDKATIIYQEYVDLFNFDTDEDFLDTFDEEVAIFERVTRKVDKHLRSIMDEHTYNTMRNK